MVDAQFLLVHQLDRKALSLLSHATPSSPSPLFAPSSGDASEPSSFPFGRLALAVELLYHALTCKRALYGDDSMPVLSHVEFVVALLNHAAVAALRSLQTAYVASASASKEQKPRAKQLRTALRAWPLTWLKDAEALCLAHPPLLHAHVQTLHHLALLYRALHKPRTAARLLQHALLSLADADADAEQQRQQQRQQCDSLTFLRCRAILHLDLAAILAQQACWEQAGTQVRHAVSVAQQLVLALTAPWSGAEDAPKVAWGDATALLQTAYGWLARVEERLHGVGCARWWERAAELGERVADETEDTAKERASVKAELERMRRRVEEAEKERRRAREQRLVQRGGWKVVVERNPSQQAEVSALSQRAALSAKPRDSKRRPRTSAGAAK